MDEKLLKDLKERHGEEVFVVSRKDMEGFTDFMRENHPEVYEYMKEHQNFDMTPISIKDYKGFKYWAE